MRIRLQRRDAEILFGTEDEQLGLLHQCASVFLAHLADEAHCRASERFQPWTLWSIAGHRKLESKGVRRMYREVHALVRHEASEREQASARDRPLFRGWLRADRRVHHCRLHTVRPFDPLRDVSGDAHEPMHSGRCTPVYPPKQGSEQS